MTGVLIDTATVLDLVLYCQAWKGRARSISSSAGAAVEALILYDAPAVDGASFSPLTDHPKTTRYLEYYCDDPSTVPHQVRDLLSFVRVLPASESDVLTTYSHGVDLLASALARIEDPEDIQAYQLYDYLPYHLGEDPTAIECQIAGRSIADLENLIAEFPRELTPVLERFCNILRSREQPTRAAWVLPILRLVYYEALQTAHSLHYVPHATKATLRFGHPGESVRSKRLLDYCHPDFRMKYFRYLADRFGDDEVSYPVPNVAAMLTVPSRSWQVLVERIAAARASNEAVHYRSALARLLDALARRVQGDGLAEQLAAVQDAERVWSNRLPAAPLMRRVSVSAPLFSFSRPPFAREPLVLTHPILPGC